MSCETKICYNKFAKMRLRERYVAIFVYVLLMALTLFFLRDYIVPPLSTSTLPSAMTRPAVQRRGITAKEFQQNPLAKTGNPLIDNYGQNDLRQRGENGSGVSPADEELFKVKTILSKYRVNTYASDIIPLNRVVPDSRFPECETIIYEHDLPNASIIIPFYNEWPSILLRTVYSIINRTPRHLLHEIILMDDNSDLDELKEPLTKYIDEHFPEGLVRLVRVTERAGLIKARQMGWRVASGDVIVIFDSHMEVNKDWLQPLVTEIKKDRKIIALGTLDYILAEDLQYSWHKNYLTRYGFDWRMVFFETFFRPDQYGPEHSTPKIGTVMVGTAYAMDRKYFGEIGGFDEKMKVWGGENIELAWRVWMCGGRLIHLPCSKVGHIARVQPYKFPQGRKETEIYNYKRAIMVWMDPQYRQFVYNYYPEMKAIDVGDLGERLALKERLQCKSFTWFLENIWPELNIFNRDALAWGSVTNPKTNYCLDNNQYLFQAPEPLVIGHCHKKYATQGFTWKKNRLLRTSLQCVVVKQHQVGARPQLEDCLIGPKDKWTHEKGGFLRHDKSGLCIGMDAKGLVMNACFPEDDTQKWRFQFYNTNSQ